MLDGYHINALSPPVIDGVTLAEARIQTRAGSDSQSTAKLRELISATREAYELISGRAVGYQEIEVVMDYWPTASGFKLPRNPVHAFTSLTYTDEDDTTATYSSANYIVDLTRPARFALKNNSDWPTVTLRRIAGVKLRYFCGYGREVTATADATTDLLTSAAHGLKDGQSCILRTSGTMPGGLSEDTRYWIRSSSTNTFGLAASKGGVLIDITSTGAGTLTVAHEIPEVIRQWMLLKIEQYFTIRTPVLASQIVNTAVEVPGTVDLLMNHASDWAF